MKSFFTFILISFATAAHAQDSYLKPEKYDGTLKSYYDSLFPLLHKNFISKPYARFTLIPSFDIERSFSVEQKEGSYFIISNTLTKSYWYTKDKKKVKTRISQEEIDAKLYEEIGELFQLLARQSRKSNEKLGFDGETYYFDTTDSSGHLKTGSTWSPSKDSLMGRLVTICDRLYYIGKSFKISQSDIEMKIDELIIDLKNQDN